MTNTNSDSKALSHDTTVIEANRFPIQSVKLFGSGTAEVTRTFPLSFLRSQDKPQVVEIVHLPDGLQSVNISVTSTSGNVTILDHYHTAVGQIDRSFSSPSSASLVTDGRFHAAIPKHTSGKPVPSDPRLHELETEQQRLKDEKWLRQQSFTFLTTYMDSLAQCNSHGQPEAAQMVSFFDDYVQMGITRHAVVSELDAKLADIDTKIKEEAERLSRLDSDLPVKVVAVLSCSGQVPVETAELSVKYVVRQVSWKPVYDLHAMMVEDTPSATVRLDFRCAVTQWTGEDWENIRLVLTTADQVSELIQLPEPKSIYISLLPNAVPPPMLSPPLRRMEIFDSVQERWPQPQGAQFRLNEEDHVLPARRRYRYRYEEPVSPNRVSVPPPSQGKEAFMEDSYQRQKDQFASSYHRRASPHSEESVRAHAGISSIELAPAPNTDVTPQTVSQLVSYQDSKNPITHIANGSIFIPSDHTEHHVLVTSLFLKAEFMRVVVPSTDTRVYYTCQVENTSKYILPLGTVKAYLNDKHVSSTNIRTTELPQILECPLAVDPGMKTIHNRAPDALPFMNASSGKSMTTYTSATVIQNTHEEPIRGVVVRSSIPLPTDPRITIVLKEPAGLAEKDEGNVAVKEGCLVRWSTMGGRKGKQAGLFEWVCDVNPGTEVLKAVWEVCAPQDLKLSERARS